MQKRDINKINVSNSIEFDKAYNKTKFDKVYYLKLKAPLFVQFELTYGCNQSCCFCYNVWKEEPDDTKISNISKIKQLEILDNLIENEIFSIIFSGGEPLLIDWLEELIIKAYLKGIESSLITNGILLTKDKATSLKNAGLSSIQISLHHFNESIHNILVNKDTFQKSINGIRNAIDVFGSKKISVNMVILTGTYIDVYEMAGFLNDLGVKHFSIGTPTVTGELSKNKNKIISKDELKEVYYELRKAKKDFNIKTTITGGFPLCILPVIDSESISMINNYCDAGLNQIVIDPVGNIRPCVCLNNSLGNILKDNIIEIWQKNDFLIKIRELRYLPIECNECIYVHICRGGCRASAFGYYGDLCSIDPLMK